jgi:C1A family cysteine protease
MEIFARTAQHVDEHNSQNSAASYRMGINKFSDMTEDELRARLGLAQNRQGHRKIDGENSFIIFNTTDLPSSVDWRPTGAVTPVQDQGSCGSCYAFSAVGAIEGAYWKLTNKTTAFSVQQIVDCADGSYQNQGCGGGLPDWVFDYVWDNGLQTNATYPYTGGNGYCNDDPQEYVVQLTHYYDVTHLNPDQLKGAVQQVGPISIGVGAGNPAWFNYAGGIIDDANVCKPNLDHAVLLVGYGSENGKDYWIVKNTWGADWGENGYVRILISSGFGVCGVNMTPIFPTLRLIR